MAMIYVDTDEYAVIKRDRIRVFSERVMLDHAVIEAATYVNYLEMARNTMAVELIQRVAKDGWLKIGEDQKDMFNTMLYMELIVVK